MQKKIRANCANDVLNFTIDLITLTVLYADGWEDDNTGEKRLYAAQHYKKQTIERLCDKGFIEIFGKKGNMYKLTPEGVAFAKTYLYNLTGIVAE